jgi:hypothetical protein
MSHKVKVLCGSREIRNLLADSLGKNQPEAKLEMTQEGNKYCLTYFQAEKPDLDKHGLAKGASFQQKATMKALEKLGLVKFEYLGEVEDGV